MAEFSPAAPAVNTEQRFTAAIVLDVKTKDGQPFFSAELKYADFPYSGVVTLEREAIGLADRLTQYGEAAVAVAKGGNPAPPKK